MTYTTDDITVLVPTSPIPSHPSTEIIEKTLASIHDQLPGVPLFVMCDGVRPEQQDRAEAYGEFLKNLHLMPRPGRNDFYFKAPRHWHQSGMMRNSVDLVTTPFLLFVEHDTPLTGEIPWDQLIEDMDTHDLNLIRFMHETHVLEEHEYLFDDMAGDHLRRTRQFSARPHLARTSFYVDIMDRFFDEQSRSFIEDQVYGPALVEDFKMAVYLPEGNAQRSLHTDGRASDPKFDQIYVNGRDKP